MIRAVGERLPTGVSTFDVFFGVFPPDPQPILVVRQIKLPVDDGPSLGINRVLVGVFAVRHTHCAIAVVLRRVLTGAADEQVAVSAAGEPPLQFVPEIFEFGLALDWLSIGEISDGIIPADRELRLFTTGNWYKSHRDKEPETHPSYSGLKRQGKPIGPDCPC